ncbi:MAG: hypothetical protein FJ392_00210 [Verrucomicrobia bacterium]|nr:hypothetical protein [Verrucomicrobiota bacterium]
MRSPWPQHSLRSALSRVLNASVAMEKMERCDGCRRFFSLRGVELIGRQILCTDCTPAEFNAPLNSHLPTHPRLLGERTDARA